MKEFLKLFLRAQTVLGLIPFLVLVVSDCVIIGFGLSTYEREAFSCEPRLNASMQRHCYDDYSSEQFLNFYLMLVFDGVFCFVWIIFIVKTTLVLRQIKRSRQIQNNASEQPTNPRLDWPPAKFMEKSCCGLCYFVTHVTVVIILLSYLYVTDSGFNVSSMYKCSLQDTTSIPTNYTKTDFFCYDQNFKEQVNFNIATTVIKFIIWILCLISFIYVFKTPKDKLMNTLLGDVAEERLSNPEGNL